MPPDLGQPVPASEPLKTPAGTIQSTALGFGASDVDPSPRLPEAVAKLTVQRDDKNGFMVHGMNVSCPLDKVSGSTYGVPQDMELNTMLDEPHLEDEHHNIIDILREWSQVHNEISGWINDLRAKFKGDLRLVIMDNAGFNFPWELLWLDGDKARSLPAGWLGSLVSVARWTTLNLDVRDPYADDPGHCNGPLLAYVNEAMKDDYNAFIDYTSQTRDEIGNLDGFLKRAKNPDERFALLYVAAHGNYSPRWESMKLASRSILKWKGNFGTLRKNSGLVFLNACHTGELVSDKRQNDGLLRGFAQMFLQEGAQGVLATLGRVEHEQAREIAGSIIAALANAQGAEVSVVLRDLRADCLEKMGGLADNTDLRPFFNMFMYVYFGNPALTVQLIRNPAP